ncbi:hypothetical protein GZ77_21175 [Endozoicomonas montiporae]|uniref:Uncharacterized protein n=2 Tax=Endozoicomonas montiporae TaxID=1027273 RepID=A0A081N3C3_9GAMM|nr:hypothetical protein [Endozoicomonas montiporae]AMO58243.1 hypothetical protein EZMO1_4326 [Endozoicomonas montiporae CL-33]KEQ12946.1 hypothetical protein GZ77_21175 [Endozoicomonas montiporae]
MSQGTGKKRISNNELRRKALDLRTIGLSYQQIADQLGVSKSAAHRAVVKSLEALQEETKKLAKLNKTLDLQRLELIIREAMKLSLKGDLQAMDRVMKAIDRRAKIYGFEAPQKISQTTPEGEEIQQGVVVVPSPMDLEDWVKAFQQKQDK